MVSFPSLPLGSTVQPHRAAIGHCRGCAEAVRPLPAESAGYTLTFKTQYKRKEKRVRALTGAFLQA